MPDAAIDRLGDLARHPSVASALAAVRGLLGLDIAYATFHEGDTQVIEAVDSDAESLIAPGARFPLELTFCQRILAGELPTLLTDAQAHPVAAEMPVTQITGIRAYASVPLVLSSGDLHGTLCCGGFSARPDLGDRDVQFLHVIARIVADQVERDLVSRAHEAERLETAGVEALLAAVEARDGYTGEHSRAVVEHAVAVARELGLSERDVREIEHVALLHDVGKLGMPDAVLHKPGPLDPSEWELMRQHPVVGERVVACLPGLERLSAAVRAEHERWDGTGYPDGLTGEQIPLASRIALVCDAYHAMTSDRPYRRALPREVAVEELRRNAGTQFCPCSVAALLSVLGAGESGARAAA